MKANKAKATKATRDNATMTTDTAETLTAIVTPKVKAEKGTSEQREAASFFAVPLHSVMRELDANRTATDNKRDKVRDANGEANERKLTYQRNRFAERSAKAKANGQTKAETFASVILTHREGFPNSDRATAETILREVTDSLFSAN